MILDKWNYKKYKYELYKVPDNWNCKTYSNNMKEIVNCPHCGKELEFGNCYTSLEIHTKMGFGYGVCEKCYEEEWNRRRQYEQKGFF